MVADGDTINSTLLASPLYLPEADFSISPTPINVSGGSCELYLGEHVRLGQVAMKRLRWDPSRTDESMEQEGKMWSSLDHPHVLKFLGICKISVWIYLVSPFVEHGSTRSYLIGYPYADRRKILYETALAIAYLHKNGVIHGDIKGDNILISSQHSALLCDFGLARSSDIETSLTRRGKGTLRWMSPELLDGSAKSFASDIYAFGMTIYELLSGNVPFHNCKLDVTVLHAIIKKKRPPKEPSMSPGGFPYERLWEAAQKAWSEDARRRPSISELLPSLQQSGPSLPPRTDDTVPSLARSIAALGIIKPQIERITYNKAKCKTLSQKANNIIRVIQDNYQSGDSDQRRLDKAIAKILDSLEKMQVDFDEWSRYGFWKSWSKRDAMEERLQSHEANLEECISLISLATVLDIHAQVKKLQEVNSAQTTDARDAQAKLLGLSIGPDDQSVPKLIGELEGECTKKSDAPALCGSTFDVWEGLWLGKIKVSLKLWRDFRVGVRDERSMMRFIRQIDIWKRLDDPHVLPLHGWCRLDESDEIYLVSPWLENEDIKKYLAKREITAPESITLIKEILLGLQYLHRHKVLHGSIQPSNILIQEQGHAVVSDFTLAKIMAPNVLYTRSNTHVSALRYQAPEISENKPMTVAGDVYSWAMTSLEVISGYAPFHIYKTPGQMMKAIVAERQVPQAVHHACEAFTTYPTLWEVFSSCWNRGPEERPSVEAVLRRLDDLLARDDAE